MSDLTFIEKRKLEGLFAMASGYVLNFSNRTFAEFCVDSVGKDIYDDTYANGGGSKASRLRAFWTLEPNHTVAKLLTDLLDYESSLSTTGHAEFHEDCISVVERLKQASSVIDIEAIAPNSTDRDFEALANSVRDAIGRNEPETGLDRLHTFLMKYVRIVCVKHGISADRDKPLHSLFGEYVKLLKCQGKITSEMTERILKSNISIIEAFNRVRNEQSFAHDNPILNYNEALLIFNNIASAIRFVAALEGQSIVAVPAEDEVRESSDIPF